MNTPKLLLTLTILTLSFSNAHAKENSSILDIFGSAVMEKKIITSGFADVIEPLLPAVVNISTTQEIEDRRAVGIEELFGGLPPGRMFQEFEDLFKNRGNGGKSQKRKVSSLGSGFIISRDGYIVTNYHVIKGADEIEVILSDTNKFKAKVVGSDKKTDLALLKIDANYDLKYVKFGDSTKSRIGEWVIAVGNPFGLGGSVSTGIVSARGRDINSGQYDNFIQTDAAINKGNSGGPLFNIKGEVIGIATAIYSPSGGNVGIGFATPSSTATPIIEQLKNKGEVTRGWLGVSIQNVSEEMAKTINMEKPKGAFVAEVLEDSPAQQAGILATDIIIKFDGKDIKEMKDLPKIVAATPIDKKVKIVVIRQGAEKTLKTRVKKMEQEALDEEEEEAQKKKEPEKASSYLLDMGLIEKKSEITIVDIKENSAAAKKGIKEGDVILSANQVPTKTIQALEAVIKTAKDSKKDNIFLFIRRDTISKKPGLTERQSISFAIILPINK